MHGYPTESLAKHIANLIEASTILTAKSTMNARRYTLFAALTVAFAATLRAGGAEAQGYVRVGLGASLASETQFKDVDCASAMPAALYGCGEGGDGAPLSTTGKFAATAGLGIGAGYAVGPAASIELQLDYRPNVPFEGQANFLVPEREQTVSVERSSLAATVAAMIDLQALWALEVSAWRYADRGDAVTAQGAGRVEWRDGSRTVALDLAPTRAQVNQHRVVLSVRYGW